MRKGLVLFRLSALLVAGLMLVGCGTGFGRSGNADLLSLVVEGQNESVTTLTPSFDSDETEYTVDASLSILTVAFNVEAEDENATMTLNGEVLFNNVDKTEVLDLGVNEFFIVVTAENESTKTYEVVITRSNETSDNAYLNSLELENVELSPEYNTDTYVYTADVNFFVNTTILRVDRANDLATAVLNDQIESPLNDNEASDAIDLSLESATTVTVDVTAGDQETEQSYSVAITRTGKDGLSTNTNFFKASNSGIEDGFGSVLDFDGETLVVGVPLEDSAFADNEGNDAADEAGAAYIFAYSGSDWEQIDYLKDPAAISVDDKFGASVSVDGTTMIIGAPGIGSVTGSVFVYLQSESGVWEFNSEFPSTSLSDGDLFGFSVSVKGDFIVVGAPGANSDQGTVYVYENISGTWTYRGSVSPTASGGRFGETVRLNEDTDYAEFVVSAPQENSEAGAIYVSNIPATGNNFEISLSTPAVAGNAEAEDAFGSSVYLLKDRIAVGAPGEDSDGVGVGATPTNNEQPGSGAVYVFNRDDNSWVQSEFFKAPQSAALAFGTSVALSADSLAVGAPGEGSDVIGTDDDPDAGNDNINAENSGAVYVFQLSDSDWETEVLVKARNRGVDDRFGESIGFDGGKLFVGAPGEDSDTNGFTNSENELANESGAVYLIQ